MKGNEEVQIVCCMQCGRIWPNDGTESQSCPDCHKQINLKEFNDLLVAARHASRYAIQYRELYERELRDNGRIKTKACLFELPDIYIFAIAAVASGIIGNASYDLIKLFIRRLSSQSREYGCDKDASPTVQEWQQSNSEERIARIANDEFELSHLINYLREYEAEFYTLKPVIREAILEEIWTDYATEITMEDLGHLLTKEDGLNKKDRKEFMDQVQSILQNKLIAAHNKLNEESNVKNPAFNLIKRFESHHFREFGRYLNDKYPGEEAGR